MKKIIVLMTFTFSLNLFAFTLSSQPTVKFTDHKVTINAASNDCTLSVTAGELLGLAEKAADQLWNRVSTCSLDLQRGGILAGVDTSADSLNAAVGKAQGQTILIGCSTTVTGSTLGIGGNNGANVGVLLINDSNTNFANLTESEKIATLAHELGHAFGLGHSSDPVALMYYAVGGTIREKLTLDDFDGCTYLYPHSSPGSCGSVAILGDKGDNPTGKLGFFSIFSLGLLISMGLMALAGKISKFKM